MGRFVFKLPDLGEGTAEAEIVAWHAKVGDMVSEDAPLVDMLTDKATVEMTSPVAGKLIEISGAPGDMAAVGGPIAVFEVEGAGNAKASDKAPPQPAAAPAPAPEVVETPAPERLAPKPAFAGRRSRASRAGRGGAPRDPQPRGGRKAARLARRPPPGGGLGHQARPRRRDRSRRPHHPRGPGRLHRVRRKRRRRERAEPRQAHRDRRGEGHRHAPRHRPPDAGVQAPHPALRLCRGGGRHRAGGPARASVRDQARRPAQADHAAVPDAGSGAGIAAVSADKRPVRR